MGAERLAAVRGNLRKPKSRAAAVWELLVLHEALQLGEVEYEPEPGGSPDVRLTPAGARSIWLEARFLYPRFWANERVSGEVPDWVREAARRFGVKSGKLSVRLDGDRSDPRGPVRTLPHEHERWEFQRHPEPLAFFECVRQRPLERSECKLSDFSVAITYHPDSESRQAPTGGLVQEAPRVVGEHAVYRALCQKAKQHDVEGPKVVAIGSDQSRVLGGLRGPLEVRLEAAVGEAFRQHRSLSAALLVSVQNEVEVFVGLRRRARGELYLNPWAKDPLVGSEEQSLRRMNFNRWAFGPPLEPWNPQDRGWHQRMGGHFQWSRRGESMNIKIPVAFIAEVLGGRTSVRAEFGAKHQLTLVFEEGWEVTSCAVVPGDAEQGSVGQLELEMVPPGVYWPTKPSA